ncbi:MarR family winged helix-turn-helix transcriptional regulator [Streptomyces sp. NBC_01483]|uniref:MarR family winged helix-turn-helix transcriptional regulator n=1 Tax=Streptomyces sp. NBC_01483 TaxID=2903883 RepID=UPI002E351055|nr:MarR family transcriptional regulator [Streptomyces sp. NBC_01483]
MDGQDPEVRDDIPPQGRDNTLLQAADQLTAAAEILVAVSAHTAVAVDSRLSPPLLRALTLVGTDPGLTLAALAERAQVSRSRASRVCDSLEEAGLLARSPRTEDRRGVGLSLTGRGRCALDRVRAQRTAWIGDALLRMPESDLSGLLAALRSLGPSLAHGHPEHSPQTPWPPARFT